MKIKSVTVLFTSVGRRVELLRAFRAAADAAGVRVRILACDVDPLAPALREADRAFLAPRCLTPEYGPFLAEICREEGVDGVFPLIDTELEALAAARGVIESAGARVGLPEMEILRRTLDKKETLGLFREAGLRVPSTWFPGGVDVEALPYPVIVKPRRGSASQGVFRVETAEDCRFFLGYVKEAMVQECLPGPEITTDVFVGPSGRLLGLCSRERIEVRWGEAAKAVTVDVPEISAACETLAKMFGPSGPFTVQCLLKEGRPHFTEINARMGGGLPLAFAGGMNGHVRLLRELAGLENPDFDLHEVRTGVHMSRFDDAVFLTEADEGVRFT
ncbi:MAG: ATP-grasp domain-containing protein [Verrucomicrobia bacterium]|nr:ATP-grasp domain-containing protein [Verrucomicrobiota bacterium]MCH8526608.1 ATP-grasp domain-containing protein [Kiritimatiellia bacterium]